MPELDFKTAIPVEGGRDTNVLVFEALQQLNQFQRELLVCCSYTGRFFLAHTEYTRRLELTVQAPNQVVYDHLIANLKSIYAVFHRVVGIDNLVLATNDDPFTRGSIVMRTVEVVLHLPTGFVLEVSSFPDHVWKLIYRKREDTF